MSQTARNYEQTRHTYKENQRIEHASSSTISQPKRRLITPGEKVLWSLGIALIFLLAISIVSKEAAIYNVNSQVQQLKDNISSQNKVNSQLEVKVTSLLAPSRIKKIARNQLGLTLNGKNVNVIQH